MPIIGENDKWRHFCGAVMSVLGYRFMGRLSEGNLSPPRIFENVYNPMVKLVALSQTYWMQYAIMGSNTGCHVSLDIIKSGREVNVLPNSTPREMHGFQGKTLIILPRFQR